MMDRRERMRREFYDDLRAAQILSERALNYLYVESGPNRGFWYRWRLGRAQNTLMKLVVKEAKRKANEDDQYPT